MPHNPLIPALDADDPDRVRAWARDLGPLSGYLKVGLQAVTANGPGLLEEVAAHAPVFADLKLHDIPNTVAGAAAAASDRGVAMLTVHASGGAAMVAAAVRAAPDVAVLAVTVLTSIDRATAAAIGQPDPAEQVPRLARLAVDAGAAGIVCAASEIEPVRAAVGPDALVVVPGIRPRGWAAEPTAAPDDQARTATAEEALRRGASHVVVGRPITASPDPVAAARAILEGLALR